MNSADAWHAEDNYQQGGEDNLESLLGLSVELQETMNAAHKEIEMEAAKERHPSGKAVPTVEAAAAEVIPDILNAADRCDAACSAAALYRMQHDVGGHELDFCHHHFHKNSKRMTAWSTVGINQSLMDELYNTNRLKGGDHA